MTKLNELKQAFTLPVIVVGIVVFSLSVMASFMLKETFHKDLDYLEE